MLGKHETRSSVFFNKSSQHSSMRCCPGGPSSAGRAGGSFCAWKNILWCSSGACRDFPFSVAFLISMGKSNACMSLHKPGAEHAHVLASAGAEPWERPHCLPQVSWLHCAPGTAPSMVCGSRDVALPCLKTRPKHQSHLGASGGFAFDLPDSKRGLQSVFLPFTA